MRESRQHSRPPQTALRMKSKPAYKIVSRDAERVNACVCWRYVGQRLPSGTRVDLQCGKCNHRVAADQDTIRFHAAGAVIVCQECIAELPTVIEKGKNNGN